MTKLGEELARKMQQGCTMQQQMHDLVDEQIPQLGRTLHFIEQRPEVADLIHETCMEFIEKGAKRGLPAISIMITYDPNTSDVADIAGSWMEEDVVSISIPNFTIDDLWYTESAFGENNGNSFRRAWPFIVCLGLLEESRLLQHGLETKHKTQPHLRSLELTARWMKHDEWRDICSATRMPGGIEALRIGIPAEDILA
jgi:hypothetical protein